ncbi:hypothetical protein RCF19_30125 [Rhodococcus qingshengii]
MTTPTTITAPIEQHQHTERCSIGVFHDLQLPDCPHPATWLIVAHDCQAPGADITGYIECRICDRHAAHARQLPAPFICPVCDRVFAHWQDWFRTLHRL